MNGPYEARFADKQMGELPMLTAAAERSCAAKTTVRFAADGEYRLLVTTEGACTVENACLLRPGQTVLCSFSADTVLCDISFQGSGAERFFALPQQSKPAFFTVAQPMTVFAAARDVVQLPDGCNAALYRSSLLLRIFSCFPAAEADREADSCGKRAMQYIRENYMCPINVNDIASAMGVSRSWLYRCFMDYAEQSPAMYLRDVRLQKAKSLLRRTDLPVQEIAKAVGYEDALYFSRVFSDYIGCPPSVYRKNCNE